MFSQKNCFFSFPLRQKPTSAHGITVDTVVSWLCMLIAACASVGFCPYCCPNKNKRLQYLHALQKRQGIL